ncbi:hypothetical protein HU200_011974 [Digitaria exilis]|uniref:FAD-binding FR-type domain-containing protein n=1 Tax=Digitaria exilis TaxID=1010633 RepID=A0A835FFQ4_9POAL|nr:hypothetical protein HU200_011974 [Digitaria exilis]
MEPTRRVARGAAVRGPCRPKPKANLSSVCSIHPSVSSIFHGRRRASLIPLPPSPGRLTLLPHLTGHNGRHLRSTAASPPRAPPPPLPHLLRRPAPDARAPHPARPASAGSPPAVHAVKQDAAVWTPAPVSAVGAATADGSIFHVAVDLSDAADLADSYTSPGQYLQIRVPSGGGEELKAGVHAVASPPGRRGAVRVPPSSPLPGTTAERLCGVPRRGRGGARRGHGEGVPPRADNRPRTPRRPCSSSRPGRGSG